MWAWLRLKLPRPSADQWEDSIQALDQSEAAACWWCCTLYYAQAGCSGQGRVSRDAVVRIFLETKHRRQERAEETECWHLTSDWHQEHTHPVVTIAKVSGKTESSSREWHWHLRHNMDLGTVNFDDLFDFSPEPPSNIADRAEDGDKGWVLNLAVS